MEALSPRSINLPSRQPQIYKPSVNSQKVMSKEEEVQAKAAEKRKLEKEKNHALPPPQWVTQPAGPDGQPSEKYYTGKLLGRGGFAICYEGKLVGKKTSSSDHKFALKIVKATMGVKKMEEKVCYDRTALTDLNYLLTKHIVQNRATDSFQTPSSQYSRISSRFHL